jgi:tetratricopeptide (TPR) repeat protein
VKSTLRLLCRWLYLPLAVLCGFYLSLSRVQHSNWYKERLYHQLLSGNEQERLKAASALASVGGQDQLLTALKSDTPAIRELARRALEYLWFTDAGHHAHQVIEEAFDAAEKEDFQTALGLLDRLIQEHPSFAEGWNRRASVYWKMGQFDKSIADCEKALALNPNHYGAWQGIGVCRVELGDIAEACRCLRAALKITPYDEPTRRCLQKCEELLRNMPNRGKASGKSDFI